MSVLAVPLGEIVTFIRGVTFDKAQEDSKASDENLPLLRAGNIGRQLDLTCDLIYLPRSIVSTEQLLQKGDIVICLSSGSPKVVGKTAVFKGDSNFSVGAFCGIIRPRDILDSDYLTLWFRSAKFTDWRDEQARGANIQNLRFSELAKLKIILPDKPEQCRIVARLGAKLSAVEEARRAAEAQTDELTQLANAVVRQSVLHPDTEPSRLGEVLEEVKKGIGTTWDHYPVLGATRAGLALAKDPVGKKPERYKPVTTGTVFYNPMRIMIGSIAMVDDDDTPGITSPDYVVLKGKKSKLDSRWFYYWLRSPYGEHCIASLSRGAVRERMLFNRLADGDIELPPYEVQQFASQQLAQIMPMKTAIESQLKEIEILPSRLLAQAFGEA